MFDQNQYEEMPSLQLGYPLTFLASSWLWQQYVRIPIIVQKIPMLGLLSVLGKQSYIISKTNHISEIHEIGVQLVRMGRNTILTDDVWICDDQKSKQMNKTQ